MIEQATTKESSFDFCEEIRLGYTITQETKKLWAVQLEILSELDRVCKELNISYFLDSGTLLGAVRDGHFIPWDDDIDVIMLRKDYDILVNDKGNSFKKNYFFQCAYTDNEYPRGHAQLRKKGTCAMLPYEAKYVQFDQSIFIDIFVLDGIAPDKKNLIKQFREKDIWLKIMNIMSNPASPNRIKMVIKRLLIGLCKCFYHSVGKLYSRYENICKRYEGSEYVDKIMFRRDYRKVKYLKKEWFSEAINIPFEGRQYPIPSGYENILKAYFGESYMIPSKAPSMHGELIVDVNRSYKEVLKSLP